MIRRVRNAKSPRRKALPVVVLTGRTDTDTYQAAVRRGIQGYLMKPISPGLLVETVNKVLAARGIPAPKPLSASSSSSDKPGLADIPLPPSLDDNSTADI
jgi:DNA-binding NarL/FixJ family response regulator